MNPDHNTYPSAEYHPARGCVIGLLFSLPVWLAVLGFVAACIRFLGT